METKRRLIRVEMRLEVKKVRDTKERIFKSTIFFSLSFLLRFLRTDVFIVFRIFSSVPFFLRFLRPTFSWCLSFLLFPFLFNFYVFVSLVFSIFSSLSFLLEFPGVYHFFFFLSSLSLCPMFSWSVLFSLLFPFFFDFSVRCLVGG